MRLQAGETWNVSSLVGLIGLFGIAYGPLHRWLARREARRSVEV